MTLGRARAAKWSRTHARLYRLLKWYSTNCVSGWARTTGSRSCQWMCFVAAAWGLSSAGQQAQRRRRRQRWVVQTRSGWQPPLAPAARRDAVWSCGSLTLRNEGALDHDRDVLEDGRVHCKRGDGRVAQECLQMDTEVGRQAADWASTRAGTTHTASSCSSSSSHAATPPSPVNAPAAWWWTPRRSRRRSCATPPAPAPVSPHTPL